MPNSNQNSSRRNPFFAQLRLALQFWKGSQEKLPDLSFALTVTVIVPLVSLVVFALQTRGFVVYLHEKILFFLIGSQLYALLLYRLGTIKNPLSYADIIRLMGVAQLPLLALPFIALANLLSVVFFQFSHLAILLSLLSTVGVHLRFLIVQKKLHWMFALLIVCLPALLILAIFWAIDTFLIVNPWQLLVKFQGNIPR